MRRARMAYLVLLIASFLADNRAGAADPGDEPHHRATPRKVLLDTDPGGDDIVALLWLESLAKQGVAEIVAVTTVGGNVDNGQTFANASRILALGGFGHVPLGRGVNADKPAGNAAHIHGQDGMGSLSQTLPPPKHSFDQARRADDILIEQLSAAPGEITVVAIGPLTNLAAAEQKCPGILSKAREVVLMGGAFRRGGNITSQAEFNIHCDPEAAEKVLASRNDVVVLPLDVTQQITFTTRLADDIHRESPENGITQFVAALSRFMSQTSLGYRDTGGVRGFHVHDAATLAYLFYPETLSLRRAGVRVETQGEWTRGQTLVDDRHLAKPAPNAWVALDVDAVNLLAILAEDLKLLAGNAGR